MKRKSGSNKGNFVWTSYSDLSTGVMLSFILMLFVFIFLFNKKKEELDDFKTIQDKAELVDSSIRANKRLNKAFGDVSTHIKKYGNDKCLGANFKSIPMSNTLRVQFAKNSSWFNSGKSTLTKQGVDCLTYFIPYFLKKIYRKDQDLKGKLARVIVEGHTNSVPFRGSKDSFYDNMELSQRRALQTVNFMMKIAGKMKNKKLRPWIIKKVSANGRGFADLIYKDNKEDKVASRRVEFKFNIDYGI
jgi:chemotaxis protein MotB